VISPLQRVKQVFTNGDGSIGILYLVTRDLEPYLTLISAPFCLESQALRSAFQKLQSLQPVLLAA
jgi:hypothetical protein